MEKICESESSVPETCLVCRGNLPRCECVEELYIPRMTPEGQQHFNGTCREIVDEQYYVESDFAADAAREARIFGRTR